LESCAQKYTTLWRRNEDPHYLQYASIFVHDLARGWREMDRLAAMKRRHQKETNVVTTDGYDPSQLQETKRSC
jgi:hypothetical protein